MDKYIEIFKTALNNPQNILLLVIGVSFGLLLLVDIITNKKFPFFGTTLLAIIVLFSGIYAFRRSLLPPSIINFLTNRYQSVKAGLISWTLYFFLLSIGVYVLKVFALKRKNKQIAKHFGALPVELLWIVNRRGRVIFETKAAQGLELSERKTKKVFVDDLEIPKRKIFMNLNDLTEVENFSLKLQDSSEEVRTINVQKKNLYKRNFYNGYLLYRQTDMVPVVKEEVVVSIDQLGLINSFDEPIAYYNLVTNTIILNQLMQNLLKVNENIISVSDFKKYILKEDLSFFEKTSDAKTHKNIFRLGFNNQKVWFEGLRLFSNDEMIIRRTSSINFRNKLTVKNHNDLINDIQGLQQQHTSFGLIALSFVDIIDKTGERGENFVNQIISQYFKNLLEGHLRDNIVVYKLGHIEFGMLFKNLTTFDIITKEIVDGRNHFKKADVTINNETFSIDLALGVVSSKSVENLPAEDIITASYEALMEASDPNYPNNYSMYYPKANVVREYRLEDFDIDLSESFLEKFKLD